MKGMVNNDAKIQTLIDLQEIIGNVYGEIINERISEFENALPKEEALADNTEEKTEK